MCVSLFFRSPSVADNKKFCLLQCVPRSRNFVFCFVVQIKSGLHIDLLDLDRVITPPISVSKKLKDLILEYPSKEYIRFLMGFTCLAHKQ